MKNLFSVIQIEAQLTQAWLVSILRVFRYLKNLKGRRQLPHVRLHIFD